MYKCKYPVKNVIENNVKIMESRKKNVKFILSKM